MDLVEVATASQIEPGTMVAVDAGGHKLLVANVDGAFHAMRRNCPHMGAAPTSARDASTAVP